MTKGNLLTLSLCALLLAAGSAVAADYNDVIDGNWTAGTTDTWSGGTGVYPGSGDTATIDSHTVTLDIDLTGDDRPDEIILDGGTLSWDDEYDPYSDAIRVKSASDFNYGAPKRSYIHAPLQDYDGANTGVLTFNGVGSSWGAGLYLMEDGSAFSGGWEVYSGIIKADADGAFGTGTIDVHGGILNIHANQSAANPPAVVNVHTNGTLELYDGEINGWNVNLDGGTIRGRKAIKTSTIDVTADSVIEGSGGEVSIYGGLIGSATVTFHSAGGDMVRLLDSNAGFAGTFYVPAGHQLNAAHADALGSGSITVNVAGRLRTAGMGTLAIPVNILDGGALTNENKAGWQPTDITVTGTVNLDGDCTLGLYQNDTMTLDGALKGADASVRITGGNWIQSYQTGYVDLNNPANDFDGLAIEFAGHNNHQGSPGLNPGYRIVSVTAAGAAGTGTVVVYNNRLRTNPPSGTASVLGSVPAVEVRGGTLELNTVEDQGNIHLYEGGALILGAGIKGTWTPSYNPEVTVHSGAILDPDLPLPTPGQIVGDVKKVYYATAGLAANGSVAIWPNETAWGLATMDNVPTISGTVNEAGGEGIAFYVQPLRAMVFDGAAMNTTGSVSLNGAGPEFRTHNGKGYYGYHLKGTGNFNGTATTWDMNASGMALLVRDTNGVPAGATINVNAGGLHCIVDDAIQPGAVVNINAGGVIIAAAGEGSLGDPLSTGTITVHPGGAVWMDGDWLNGGAQWDFQPGATLVLDAEGGITNCPTEVNFVLTGEKEDSISTGLVLGNDTRITVCPGYEYSDYYDRGRLSGAGDITTTGGRGRIAMARGPAGEMWRLAVEKKINFPGKTLVCGDTSEFASADFEIWYGVERLNSGPVRQDGMVHLDNAGNVIGTIEVAAGALRVDETACLGGAATIDLAAGTLLQLDLNSPALASVVTGSGTILVGDGASGTGWVTLAPAWASPTLTQAGLSPGASVGELAVEGKLAFDKVDAGGEEKYGRLWMEFEGAAAPGVDHDHVSVTDDADLTDGELVLHLPVPSKDFVPGGAEPVFLTAAGGVSGSFTVVSLDPDMDATVADHWSVGPADVDTSGGTTASLKLTGTTWTARKGNANLDDIVDVLDLARLANNFGKDVAKGDEVTWLQADFNLDGEVDVLDLAAIANNFGQSGKIDGAGGAGGAPVPEPGSAVLLTLGLSGVLVRRRRRS